MTNKYLELIAELNPEALKADGFDDCIIGICEEFGKEPRLAYSVNAMLGQMMFIDRMSEEEALEYFDYRRIHGRTHACIYNGLR